MVKQYQPFIVQYKNKQYLTMSIKCQSTMKHFKSIHHIHIYLPENDYHFNVCVHSLPKSPVLNHCRQRAPIENVWSISGIF